MGNGHRPEENLRHHRTRLERTKRNGQERRGKEDNEQIELKKTKEKQLIEVEAEASEYIKIIRKREENVSGKETNHNRRTN